MNKKIKALQLIDSLQVGGAEVLAVNIANTLSSYNFSSPKKIDFELEQLGNGKAFRLDNIYFATNSFELNNTSSEILFAFSDYLKLNNSLRLAIHGHTDNIGSASANLLLSKNRAKAVFSFLLDNGIKKDRLDFQGFGKQKPIITNETEKGRAQNRRTEFVILGQ